MVDSASVTVAISGNIKTRPAGAGANPIVSLIVLHGGLLDLQFAVECTCLQCRRRSRHAKGRNKAKALKQSGDTVKSG